MRQIVNSTQLDRWFMSASRDAQELLPHLVRRLIASAISRENLKVLGVAAGDEIRRRGYDGQVHSATTHPFVPEGVSVWEMGTGDPAGKFAGDYKDRTEDPRGVTSSSTTFVFVTPHSWEGKSKVEAAKRGERKWKDVRILDSSDLETWLELSPPIARWIAEQMGVHVTGLDDVRTYWEVLEAKYRSPLPAELIIGGRSDATTALADWLKGVQPTVTVQGESSEEATAFACAVIESLAEDDERDRMLSSTVLAYEPAAIDYISATPAPLIVIPVGTAATRRARAKASKTFRVIESAERRPGPDRQEGSVLKLGVVRRKAIQDVLSSKLRFVAARAERIALECKGSLWAVLVMLSSGPDEPLPWSAGAAARKLAPLVLAGQWVPSNKEDREAVARLAGVAPDELDALVGAWIGPTGPIVMRAGIWDWLPWDFAWEQLSQGFEKPLMERFMDTLLKVLLTPDPQLELEPDQRWQANIFGKQHPYSGALRSGLVGSVVQFALNDQSIPSGDGQSIADYAVRTLLDGKKLSRGIAWFTLAPWLSDLAEASPGAFLDCADAFAGDPEAVALLFAEGGPFASSPHVHLLWAIERLAWSPPYLSRSILTLGRFAAADPGGKLVNRPIGSLRDILVPWHPSTAAKVQERLDAVGALQRANPQVAWKLAVSLMPRLNEFVSTTNRPRWRLWPIDDGESATVADYWAFVGQLVRQMLSWAAYDASRLLDLLGLYDDFWPVHPELAKEVVDTISANRIENWSDANKVIFVDELRRTVNKHRAHPTAKWALPEIALIPLDGLCTRAQPTELIVRHAWLFAPWLDLPSDPPLERQERERISWELRDAAANQILETHGVLGLLKVARNAKAPASVGTAMARADITSKMEIELFRAALVVTDGERSVKEAEACQGYVWAKYRKAGTAWLDQVSSCNKVGWTVETLAKLAMALPVSAEVWERLDNWGEETARLYWERASVNYLYEPELELPLAYDRLLRAKRPYQIVGLIGTLVSGLKQGKKLSISPESIVNALKLAAQHSPKDEAGTLDLSMFSHHLSDILDYLEGEGSGSDGMAGIEWSWMPFLKHTPRGTKALRMAVAQDPEFFVKLLELAYRSDGDPPRELSSREKQIALQAGSFLREFKNVPGISDVAGSETPEGDVTFSGGRVDEETLRSWVDAVREKAAAIRRLEVCDSLIGGMLAYAPADDAGVWPCVPVRNAIEAIGSDGLEIGINIGVHNKRGGHFVEPGGKQELRLSAKFRGYADTVRSRWPRTGRILESLANDYEHQAKSRIDRERFEEFER